MHDISYLVARVKLELLFESFFDICVLPLAATWHIHTFYGPDFECPLLADHIDTSSYGSLSQPFLIRDAPYFNVHVLTSRQTLE